MTIEEYFQNYDKWSVKKQVELFNALDVKERKSFLALLSDGEYSTFIDRIRKQAVADFWTHEQELIKNGQSTSKSFLMFLCKFIQAVEVLDLSLHLWLLRWIYHPFCMSNDIVPDMR